MTDVGKATEFQIFTCVALCGWLITVRYETDSAVRGTAAALAAAHVRWPIRKGYSDARALSAFSRGQLRAQGEVYKKDFKKSFPRWKKSPIPQISGQDGRGDIIGNWKVIRKLLDPLDR